jgi:predicted  nucleic acid-binding Zn-ribbon protein
MIPMKQLSANLLKLQELEFDDASDRNVQTGILALRKKIPQPILDHYDRLTARGKKGVAVVRHQVCTGCHMRIPLGAILTLMHEEDIQTCENCGRYLVLPPEAGKSPLDTSEEPEAVETKSGTKPKLLVRAV